MSFTHQFVERPVFYLKLIETILLFTALGCILAVEDWSLFSSAITVFSITLLSILVSIALLITIICEQWLSFGRLRFTTVNKWSSLVLSTALLISTQFFSADFNCGTVNCITAQVAAVFLNVNAVVMFVDAFRYFYQFNIEDKKDV